MLKFGLDVVILALWGESRESQTEIEMEIATETETETYAGTGTKLYLAPFGY